MVVRVVMVRRGFDVYAYDFSSNRIPGEPEEAEPYWRDVGTIDSYYLANMELRSPLPNLNLYNREWRIRTSQRDFPPARFVSCPGHRTSDVIDSLVSEGAIIQGASVRKQQEPH